MTEEEACEGLNRKQRRMLLKLVKDGLNPSEARTKILESVTPLSKSDAFNGNIKAPSSPKNRTTFIRKNSG